MASDRPGQGYIDRAVLATPADQATCGVLVVLALVIVLALGCLGGLALAALPVGG